MPQTILLSGSNRGDRAAWLEQARREITRHVGRVVQASSVRESEPWGFSDTQNFLNQALLVETELEPTALLDEIQAIEKRLGRVRSEVQPGEKRRYEPRTIDIDILFYNELILNNERLTIPHPLIREREFVLDPLREIVPEWMHPVYGKAIREL